MISFQQIHYILTLSEELQFQRASDRCFVTQPTLSMQIKKAEEVFGRLIFDRSRHPLELTAFGKELLPFLRDTLFEYEKIHEFQNIFDSDNFSERLKIKKENTKIVKDICKIWLKTHEISDEQLEVLKTKIKEI